jgi:hypothetical protein
MMSLYAKPPDWRYVFKTSDGELSLDPRDCRRVIDKRAPQALAETVWELTVNGVVRRYWPEQVQSFDMVAVK